MATSRALPDGGLGNRVTQNRKAPKASARKKAVSEAIVQVTPSVALPRSKKSAGLPPSVSLKAGASNGGGHRHFDTQSTCAPSEDSAGHFGDDTHLLCARNGDGHGYHDTQSHAAVSEDSASHPTIDTHLRPARSEGGRSALLKDSSGHISDGSLSTAAGAGGHLTRDTHKTFAAQDLAGQFGRDTHSTIACEGEGQFVADTLEGRALPQLLTEIRLKHRLRQDYQRARQRLELQLLSMCCRNYGYNTLDAEVPRKKALAAGAAMLKLAKKGKADIGLQLTLAPMLAALKMIGDFEKQQTKYLETSTDGLPAAVVAWADGIRGFGRLGLAQILGETGDLALYANPSKVWKRMGLAVFDGKSQRKCTDKAKAELQGYAPSRRSIMHVIGVSLICQNKDYLRQVYDAEKLRQEQLYPHLTVGHRDKKARRYMQKRLLRELWREWRAASVYSTPIEEMPPSPSSGNGEGQWLHDTHSTAANPIPEPEAA